MMRWKRSAAAVAMVSVLAGCGSKGLAPASVPAGAMAAQALTTQDAKVKAEIAQVKALNGFGQQQVAERIHLYGLLGASDSDLAASFLVSELNVQWVTWPDAVEDALEPALLNALGQLADTDAREAAAGTLEAKKHNRRFNIWDGINSFFGVKKRHRKSGGGGAPAPAPAAAPAGGDAGGGGSEPPAPPAGG